MTEYKLSVLYLTYRPGGIDLLADSLKGQTYENYELIVVNDYDDPTEKAKSFLQSFDVPVTFYGPAKEKCYPDTPFNQCNAVNTGLLHATGDILILVMDFTWLPPNALERWNYSFNKTGLDVLMAGAGDVYGVPPPERVDPISIWNPIYPHRFEFNGVPKRWQPEVFELFYTGFPMKFFDDINGFDERSDYWREDMFYSILEQSELNNYRLFLDKVNVAKLAEHRSWNFKDPLLWHINRWNVKKSNEKRRWLPRSPNCFNLEEERK